MNRRQSIRLFLRILKYNLSSDFTDFLADYNTKPKGNQIITAAYLIGALAAGLWCITSSFTPTFTIIVIAAYAGAWVGIISAYKNLKNLFRPKGRRRRKVIQNAVHSRQGEDSQYRRR